MSKDEPGELSLDDLQKVILSYLRSARSIPIKEFPVPQGNTTGWESDLENFLSEQSHGVPLRGGNPDFLAPYNFDLKMVRRDRLRKSFTYSSLTWEEATTGVLPYRTVVLLWQYNDQDQRGYLYDAIIVPREAKQALNDWSYGIIAKSAITDALVRSQGLLSRQDGEHKLWGLCSSVSPVMLNEKDEKSEPMESGLSGPVPKTGLRLLELTKPLSPNPVTSDTSAPIFASTYSSETIQRRSLLTMKIPRKLAPLADVTGELGRYNFQCVHIEKEGDRALAVATDGTAMVSASWATTEEIVTRDVEGEAFKTEAKIAGAKKEDSFELPPATAREASFPPFRTISKEVPTVGMRIELDALITALDSLKSLAKGKGRGSLQVDLYAPLTAGDLIEIRVEKDEIRATASIATVPIGTPYPATFEKAKAECVTATSLSSS